MADGSTGLERSLRRLRRKGRRFLRRASKRRFYPIYGTMLVILFWAVLLPDSFSDFVWTYFWGPVVADVQGHPVDGISEGYNPVNTLVYGLFLAGLVYYGRRPLRKHRIFFDEALMLALLPMILVGAISRVLEDASAYPLPAAYFFVSPIIYLWIGFLSLFFVLFAGFLERQKPYEAMVLSVIPYPFALKFLWYFMEKGVSGNDLVFFMALTLLFMMFHLFRVRKEGYEMASSVLLYSTYVLSLFTYYAFSTFGSVPNPGVVPVVLGLAFGTSMLVGILSGKGVLPPYFSDRVNLAIVFAHSLDGAATWLGMDVYGYGEKHVLAGMLTGAFGGFAFFLSKVLLSLLVIYLLDVSFKKDLERGGFSNLVKFIIIFLGLGPGLRDMLRVALGV